MPVVPTSVEKPSRRALVFRFLKRVGYVVWLLLCAVLCAALVKAGYPKVSYGLLAWVALAPLAAAVVTLKRFWSSFFYGWLTGILVNAGLFYWIYYTCVVGGGVSVGWSVAAWLGLSVILGVQFALFAGSCFYLKRLPLLFPLLAACGWVALEWLHQVIAYYALGFPWVMLGYSQWNWPEMIQLAGLAGTYAVSFAVAFVGLSVGYSFVCGRFKRAVAHILLAGLVFAGVYAYGEYALKSAGKTSLLSLNVAVMQPNIDQYKKWTPEFEEEIISTIRTLGAQAANRQRMLVVWPESVTPGSLQEDQYAALFDEIAHTTGAYQLVGSNRAMYNRQHVSAFLVEPETGLQLTYDKQQLVPFGEYIPLENLVRSLAGGVRVLGELGSFTPGERGQDLLGLKGMPFGVTICYESIFPKVWREQNLDGAKFFVNITNDAWFFDTDAPYQHLAVNVFRAVETGKPVIRAANTGVSAIIDPLGRITQRAELNTQEALFASVPLAVSADPNFYTQWGDWFAYVCAALYFTILISAMVFAYE